MNICMIPARKGSERLAKKNYLKIGDLTVLEIALQKAIKSKAFDRVVVNSDDPNLEEISNKHGVNFYLRSSDLASSYATSDQVVLDFLNNYEGEKFFWVNTVSPLQTISDIQNFVKTAKDDSWKSGVSYSLSQVHAMYDGNPLNFQWENGFARTQDLKSIKFFNYAMMGWSRDMIDLLSQGQLFDNNTHLVESSKWSNFLLKSKEDMDLITVLSKAAPDQGVDFYNNE
jgi:CMP-N-acetylneuraminic acid synthetase